jgi:hypothetical protein
MPNNGLAIFIIFFGVALIDAIGGGRWGAAGFWLLIGLAFALMERRGRPQAPRPR